jgi:hypothetical protein
MKLTDFDTDNSGNLIIRLTNDGKTWLKENYPNEERNDEMIFIDLIDFQLCNGFSLVNPENIGALTSSLLIADDYINEETTSEQAQYINVYYYNYYAVYSYVKDLIEQGYVIWNRA